MFLILLKKELRVFFTSKSNLVFMVLLPILMISIFGIALDDYVQGDYGTFENGRLLYIAETSSADRLAEYNRIANKITAATGVISEQAENAEYNETDAMMAFLALFQDNFPLPYLAMVEDNFITINDNFPDPEDTARWEVLSAVGIADCFSAPLVIVHCTSDILVPIDQITREFTYPAEGDSMPEGFSTRLDASYPGKLGHSLVEELPTELVSAEKFVQSEVTGDMDLPYRQDALISVDVFDDGPTQSWGSHSAATESNGDLIDTGFVEDMFAKGLAGTERLMPGKLLLMLERYQGKSVQLPTHEGVDDTVYGSLAIYQREVVEELAVFSQNHSLEELDAAVQEAVSSVEDEAEAAAYTETWSEIKNQLS